MRHASSTSTAFVVDKHDVYAAARGKWHIILPSLISGPTDWEHMFAKRGRNQSVCPLHASRSGENLRTGREFDECGMVLCGSCGAIAGMTLLMECNGWTFPEALEAIWDLVGTGLIHEPVRRIEPTPPVLRADNVDLTPARNAARRLLEHAVPLDHPDAAPVLLYLANRGISPVYGPISDIMCVPSVRYPDEPHTVHPTMLSIVRRPTGERINLHQVYLTPDGHQADVPQEKRMFPRMDDGVWMPTVQLDPAGEILCLGEGVELAVAVRAMTDLPTWSVVAAGTYDVLELPDIVKVVLVFVDYDPEAKGATGFKKACAFATRYSTPQRIIRVLLPTPPNARIDTGYDWEDYLKDNGVHATRFVQTFRAQAERDLKALKDADAAAATPSQTSESTS